MSVDIIDLHLAKKKMKTKRMDLNSIFLTTVWKGEVVMAFFDTSTSRLLNLNCFRKLDYEEIEQLEMVITECLL
jgi:capsule polysaccharide export protein KpsC/LpsZ